jgi:hypothetical protein
MTGEWLALATVLVTVAVAVSMILAERRRNKRRVVPVPPIDVYAPLRPFLTPPKTAQGAPRLPVKRAESNVAGSPDRADALALAMSVATPPRANLR